MIEPYDGSMGIFEGMDGDMRTKKMVSKLHFVEQQSMLRLLALCYTEKTKLYLLPAHTKTWHILFGNREKFIPITEFFGMQIAYDSETDTLAYCVPAKKPEIEIKYNSDAYESELKKAIKNLYKFQRNLDIQKPFCYACNEEILEEQYFTGTVEPGNILVSMHVHCANEKELDVCGICQKVVSLHDIVENKWWLHTCKKCQEGKRK